MYCRLQYKSARVEGLDHKQREPMTKSSQLMVRLDEDSKSYLTRAAALRRVSLSDYVRMVTVAQARREVRQAEQTTISLTPEEQLAFWNALDGAAKLTEAQRELGRTMRGEASVVSSCPKVLVGSGCSAITRASSSAAVSRKSMIGSASTTEPRDSWGQ